MEAEHRPALPGLESGHPVHDTVRLLAPGTIPATGSGGTEEAAAGTSSGRISARHSRVLESSDRGSTVLETSAPEMIRSAGPSPTAGPSASQSAGKTFRRSSRFSWRSERCSQALF